MFPKGKKTFPKLKPFFLIALAVFGLLTMFFPTTKILAAEGGCVCNDATTCPSQTLSGATMIAAQNHCSAYCTTDCTGGGISLFTPYWPCRCCDGTDLGSKSEANCRRDCASHGGTAYTGDTSAGTIPSSDCPGRIVPPSGGTGTTPSGSPGCYCSGTLARAMACTTYTDCQSVCPTGTSATDITCVPGYSEATTTGGTSGGPSPENNQLCWRQSQCINNCPVAGGCTWEDPSKYPPCASSTGDWGRCIPTHAEPVTLQIPIIGVQQIANIADYIALIYKYMVSVGGILAGIMIMIGGLIYLTAGGSAERVGSAKSYIGNALIGLVLLLTSYVVLQTINPQLVQFSRFTIPLIRPARLPAKFCDEITAPLPNQPPLKFASSASVAGTLRPLSDVRDTDYNLDATKFGEMRCGIPYYEQASGDETCLGRSCEYTRAPGPSSHPGACVPKTDDQKKWDCMDVAFYGKITNYSSDINDIVFINKEGSLTGPCPYVTDDKQEIWPDFYYIPRVVEDPFSMICHMHGFTLSFGEDPSVLMSVIKFVAGLVSGSPPEYNWHVAFADSCIDTPPSDQTLDGLYFTSADITSIDANFHGPVRCDVDINTLKEPSHKLFGGD